MDVALRRLALVLALAMLAGCRVVDQWPKGRSPMSPLAASPDLVTLEIFSAPAPLDDPQLAALWREVDEQPFSPELRKNLSGNGLRVGVLSAHVPDALASLLKVTDKPISANDRTLVPLDPEPGVVLRVLQPRMGKRHELVVSPVHDQISLLRATDGQIEGKTYQKAEGRLVLRAFPETGGRVRLELTPELQYGEVKTQTTGSDGVFIWRPERPKQTFTDLKVTATLGAGQMLLITSLPNRPASVGHHFFVQQEGEKPTQRLWVLRLAQAGPDRSFADWLAAETSDDGN